MNTTIYAMNAWFLAILVLPFSFSGFNYLNGSMFSIEEMLPLVLFYAACSILPLLLGMISIKSIIRMRVPREAKLLLWIKTIALCILIFDLMAWVCFDPEFELLKFLLYWSIPGFVSATISILILHKQFYQLIKDYESENGILD